MKKKRKKMTNILYFSEKILKKRNIQIPEMTIKVGNRKKFFLQ